jgi:hypothetical protein
VGSPWDDSEEFSPLRGSDLEVYAVPLPFELPEYEKDVPVTRSLSPKTQATVAAKKQAALARYSTNAAIRAEFAVKRQVALGNFIAGMKRIRPEMVVAEVTLMFVGCMIGEPKRGPHTHSVAHSVCALRIFSPSWFIPPVDSSTKAPNT